MGAVLPLAAEASKTAFYVAAGLLAVWAVVLSALGLARERFPGSTGGGRGVMLLSGVLVLGAMVAAIATASKPAHGGRAELKPVKGAEAVQASTTPATAPAAGGGGAPKPTVAVAASATSLAFTTKALTAKAGKVTIAFANPGAIPHNVRVEDGGGKQLGGTKTIASGKDSTVVDLKAGTYVFYCSVPGHREAGMEGRLIAR